MLEELYAQAEKAPSRWTVLQIQLDQPQSFQIRREKVANVHSLRISVDYLPMHSPSVEMYDNNVIWGQRVFPTWGDVSFYQEIQSIVNQISNDNICSHVFISPDMSKK